ncbi:S1 family peptidase [Falsiroseomonas selenitidurans]|uniref:Trypsin-like peptidase domain-containing protein n=1 Tax=Falsiroseomonas selenitidurans TaxID=2716335 RepID=A0ABX1E347_9PROT|nr:serine protease [Falsiroseomonas selenitidurans]NKC30192.1 trypsin-like peptidase domain-containing protein [Falsiroseomonas selenitidurans]
MKSVTLFAALCILSLPIDASGQGTSWITNHSRSVAQITFEGCIMNACGPSEQPNRVMQGTGFVFRLPGGPTGILTALHAVCGQGKIYYRFSNPSPRVGNGENRTEIIWAHVGHDLALLRLASHHERYLEPLQPSYNAQLARGVWVTVLGHTGRASSVLDSRALLRELGPFMESHLPPGEMTDLRSMSFPDIRQPVLSLQGGIHHGDSGGPVFNDAGLVIGVANGGVPRTGATATWAIPIDAVQNSNWTRVSPTTLPQRCSRLSDVFRATPSPEEASCILDQSCTFLIEGEFNRTDGAVRFPFAPISSRENDTFVDMVLTSPHNRNRGCNQDTIFETIPGRSFWRLKVSISDDRGNRHSRQIAFHQGEKIEVRGCEIIGNEITHTRRLNIRRITDVP